jgi:hypothetical protein
MRSRADRPPLQTYNREEPLLEDRTQPHCSLAVHTQGRAGRARTWKTLQFIRFRESSAAHPPAPRVYGSRGRPTTCAPDVTPLPPDELSRRLAFRDTIPVFHKYRGSGEAVSIPERNPHPLALLRSPRRLRGAVTLQRNITRLNPRCSLPTHARVEGRSHFFGSGGPYEAQRLFFSTLADPYQQQLLPPRDLAWVIIVVIVWLGG